MYLKTFGRLGFVLSLTRTVSHLDLFLIVYTRHPLCVDSFRLLLESPFVVQRKIQENQKESRCDIANVWKTDANIDK